LKHNADQNSQIAFLQASARHKIQGFLQHAVTHIQYLDMLLREHGIVNAPKFEVGDITAVIAELDAKIEQIKNKTT
jgi:hypothetical protein